MDVWFEGQQDIACSIDAIEADVAAYGEHLVAVVARMPGMLDVTLVEETEDSVKVSTNEGMMTRSGLQRHRTSDALVVEVDEVYEAGSKVTAQSHFRHEYTATPAGVKHRLVISDMTAPGLLGGLYRRFGSGRMGAAFLEAHRQHLETLSA